MNDSLSTREAPDAATLWQYLQRLVAKVTTAVETRDDCIDDCLDILVELLGADRGAIVQEQADGAVTIVNARAPGRALSRADAEQVSRTLVQRALAEQSIVVWEALAQPLEAASAMALGLHAALAAPLHARGLPRSVVYVDFRSPRKVVAAAHREFFMAAIVLIGSVLEQGAEVRAARDRLDAAHAHSTEARRTPALDELLAPASMAAVREEAAIALAGDSPVLVLGESGSGKTLLAQALAEAIGRRPIVRVVLGGSDDLNTITSELFGHERGSFSGAATRRVGLVEYASGGTLVLDEILNLPLHAQKLLLDFTQFGTYRPLGHARPEPKRADVRIVAATNGDLAAAVKDGRFREDLYYRIAGITLAVPPLRQRRSELPSLVTQVLAQVDGLRRWKLAAEVAQALTSSSYEWPGNIRELEWITRRARDRAAARDRQATIVTLADFRLPGTTAPPSVAPTPTTPTTPTTMSWQELQETKSSLDTQEATLLRAAIERHGGVIAHAAKELGIARTTLAGRAEALGIGVGRK